MDFSTSVIFEEDPRDKDSNEFEGDNEVAAERCGLAGDATFCKVVQGLLSQNVSTIPKKTHSELKLLPTRQYLDTVLVPILMRAISYISALRPPNAIKSFAMYLLKHRDEYENPEDDVKLISSADSFSLLSSKLDSDNIHFE